jgi:hypothetical protein
MESLARAEGDVDALVAVLARDRSSLHRFQEIAETLLAAGRTGEATEWAEHGLAAFDDRADPQLVDFLCHPADALDAYLAQFEPAIRGSDNHTYAGAVEWLDKIRPLFARLEREQASTSSSATCASAVAPSAT